MLPTPPLSCFPQLPSFPAPEIVLATPSLCTATCCRTPVAASRRPSHRRAVPPPPPSLATARPRLRFPPPQPKHCPLLPPPAGRCRHPSHRHPMRPPPPTPPHPDAPRPPLRRTQSLPQPSPPCQGELYPMSPLSAVILGCPSPSTEATGAPSAPSSRGRRRHLPAAKFPVVPLAAVGRSVSTPSSSFSPFPPPFTASRAAARRRSRHRWPSGRVPPRAVARSGRLCAVLVPQPRRPWPPDSLGPIRAVGSSGPAVDHLGGPGPRWTAPLCR